MTGARYYAGIAVALAAGLVALGFALTRPTVPRGTTSAGALVQGYLENVARANHFTIDYERVLAIRTTGNTSVVRVAIRLHQAGIDPYSGKLSVSVERHVLVFRFTRSPWSVTDMRVAS